jgi:anti-anti-sigma factor
MSFHSLELIHQGSVVVARLPGSWLGDPTGEGPGNDPDARQQRAELTELPDSVSAPLILDLSNVSGVAGDGVPLLFTLSRSLRKRGKAMALCGVSPLLAELFEIVKFARVIPYFPDRDSARTWLTEESKEA